uniref:Plexin-B n=1 Tax=Aceria tosichella TaxID=561515 RepID=A0A6G1S6K0_9ACAR
MERRRRAPQRLRRIIRREQTVQGKMNLIIGSEKLDQKQQHHHQANDKDRRLEQRERGATHKTPANWPDKRRWPRLEPPPPAPASALSIMINGMQLMSKNQNCDKRATPGTMRVCRGTLPVVLVGQSEAAKSCDHLGGGQSRRQSRQFNRFGPSTACGLVALALILVACQPGPSEQQSIIVDHHHHHHHYKGPHHKQHLMMNNNNSDQAPQAILGATKLAQSFQPVSLLLAQNKSINFTHVAVDELTGTIYLGATNWLLQVSGRDLRVEQALRTGPTTSDSSLARDCTPADCQNQLASIELDQLIPRLLVHNHGVSDLSGYGPAGNGQQQQAANNNRRPFSGATMHTSNTSSTGYALLQAHRRTGTTSSATTVPTTTSSTSSSSSSSLNQGQQPATTSGQQQPLLHNNYNKLLAIDYESRHLIVCGSLNQGACRRHQLGNLSNFSELVPLPVASDDEHSSTVALVVSSQQRLQQTPSSGGRQQQSAGVLYVAATNSRLGPPNREMVPAISARSLDWSSRDRAMQIIEHSFTELAQVDVASGLRDYYLVNYVHAFQYNNFIYFATVQRKSALLQLEEWGYQTRLARLCLNDLSFQSYAEMTLECSAPTTTTSSSTQNHPTTHAANHPNDHQRQQQQQSASTRINYNLLQDAHLMQAGRQLQQQLGLSSAGKSGGGGGAVLVGAFSQSRDHTTRSSTRSAICLFPMERIEQKFQENIDLCYNGTIKSRNMDYIAGSVNDCPKQQGQSRAPSGQTGAQQGYCNEPVKLNGSIALVAEPIQSNDSELITSITSTLAPTSPVNIQWPPQTTVNSGSAGGSGSAGKQQQQTNSIRQHQVLIAGTSDGQLKRFVLVASDSRLSALEFDSVAVVPPESHGGVSGAGGSSDQSPGAASASATSPILADMHLIPASNPQLAGDSGLQDQARSTSSNRQQFVVAATAHKLVKLRVNACKASVRQQLTPATINGRQQLATANSEPNNNSSIVDDCLACSQLQDPFCGWCSNLGSCTTRDDCISASIANVETTSTTGSVSTTAQQQHHTTTTTTTTTIHWTPFDSIRCSNYQPISPKNVPVQADSLVVDVNVRLNLKHKPMGITQQPQTSTAQLGGQHHQLAAKLAKAHFVCHFDYLSLWNRSDSSSSSSSPSSASLPRPQGVTIKAIQARLNLHAGTVAIGCPLPVGSQRPSLRNQLTQSATSREQDYTRVRLSVRLATTGTRSSQQQQQDQSVQETEELADRVLLEQVLGMRPFGQPLATSVVGGGSGSSAIGQHHYQSADSIERELTFYDCSLNTDCRSCLSSGSAGRRWSCAWCPLSSKCTFNSSHPDYGCAASAVASTTPHSAQVQYDYSTAAGSGALNQIRGSHLTASLDRAQTSMLGLAIDRLDRCPRGGVPTLDGEPADFSGVMPVARDAGFSGGAASAAAEQAGDRLGVSSGGSHAQDAITLGGGGGSKTSSSGVASAPINEILVPNNVRRSVQVPLARHIQHYQPREKRVIKLECQIELEGAKARFSARLLDNTNVICQESLYSYQAEIATQRAQLSVILNDNQVIETTEVILYKCHLFGVSPPAIASSVIAAASSQAPNEDYSYSNNLNQHPTNTRHHSSASWSSNLNELFNLIPTSGLLGPSGRRQSDCSLCLNIDRKYQCSWCSNQCRHTDQCQELPASTCPPPRIDSIHPTSGPLEGGTLLTIEGSNLGSNEREIQDKILVGGEPCQLVMYSVSTRIVCKTGPSLVGLQAATVFVGNRAGVTSAHEKFHYKAVHLADVSPRIGPVSGGTRLLLSGSNLNIGSRVQVYLDDIPCLLDSTFDMTSNQIACITGPNLLASSSMRIKQLTLVIDNSTHQLPFPFTYQPDPIITSIEPAESFLSGGRLILINGQHLASPQSTKLLVYLEHRPSVTNATACQHQNDTLITCLTPAFSRADLLEQVSGSQSEMQDITNGNTNSDQLQQQQQGLSYESGGVKLKMALLMDDVKSVRNLDEYYHHLPHYITYYEDPQLFRLANQVVEYRDELVIVGDNLRIKQLDQDMQVSIGAHICLIKSIQSDRIIVEPPAKIAPIFEYGESSRRRVPVERPLLPIVALIGANLRFELGHMQYSSSQYLAVPIEQPELNGPGGSYPPDLFLDPSLTQAGLPTAATTAGGMGQAFLPDQMMKELQLHQTTNAGNSAGFVALVGLASLGFLVAISLGLMFLMARFRQTKAKQREYKRIQLQMGSLDINCQSPGLGGGSVFASGLFDKIHLPSMGIGNGQLVGGQQQRHHQQQQQQQLFANQQLQHRPIDYNTAKSKPLYQFFSNGSAQGQQQSAAGPPLPTSFPPSPLTDISSLIGSSPNHPQQHIVKLAANGQFVSSSIGAGQQHQYAYASGGLLQQHQQQQQQQQASAQPSSSSSSTSSTGSSSGSSPSRQALSMANQQQQQHFDGQQQLASQRGSSARNFNWTQEAPSTIVPYAVIEACNLTLEGKKAIKEFL